MRIEDVIAQRIAEGRAALGMKQAELGAALGEYLGKPWTRQAVSNAEKGGRAFGAADLIAVSLVLGCTVETLLEPPTGEKVTLGEGPPVDSRHFRATTSTNSDLYELATALQEMRDEFPILRNSVQSTDLMLARVSRLSWTALRGRGIEVAEDELRGPAADDQVLAEHEEAPRHRTAESVDTGRRMQSTEREQRTSKATTR